MTKYIPYENGRYRRPKEGDAGPWLCVSSKDAYTDEDEGYFEFLEVHQSARGDGIVARVSTWSQDGFLGGHGTVKAGACVILDVETAKRMRDRLNAVIQEAELGRVILDRTTRMYDKCRNIRTLSNQHLTMLNQLVGSSQGELERMYQYCVYLYGQGVLDGTSLDDLQMIATGEK